MLTPSYIGGSCEIDPWSTLSATIISYLCDANGTEWVECEYEDNGGDKQRQWFPLSQLSSVTAPSS